MPARPLGTLASRPATATPLLIVVAAVVVVLPLAVAAIAVAGQHWHPVSDVAIEMLRIDDVGGVHTPLTGAHSRYGWDHPGPLLFWLLAPFHLFGPTGVLVGVAVLNAAAMVGAMAVGHRRGGWPLVTLVGVVLLVLTRALGTSLLVDPWNPWVAVMPFFLFLLLAWSVAELDLVALPVLVLTGSFAVQAHIGYTPLVLGIAIAAGIMAWWRGRSSATDGVPAAANARRWCLVAGALLFLLWLPPLVEELSAGEGNVSELVDYLRAPPEPAVGWASGWGVMGAEVGPPGAWLSGDEAGPFGVVTRSGLPALGLLAVMVALAVSAGRSGVRSASSLSVLVLVAWVLGIVAGARVTGVVGAYLVRWWWVISATVWLSVLWSATCLLRRTRARSLAAALPVAAALALAGIATWQARSTTVPNPVESAVVRQMSAAMAAQLDEETRYLVDVTDARGWDVVGVGLFLDLHREGFSVAMPAEAADIFGDWRVATPERTDARLVIVGEDEVEQGFAPAPAARLVVHFDPLSPPDRQQVIELRDGIRTQIGDPSWSASSIDSVPGRLDVLARGAARADVEQLARLRARGSAYDAYVVPIGAERPSSG